MSYFSSSSVSSSSYINENGKIYKKNRVQKKINKNRQSYLMDLEHISDNNEHKHRMLHSYVNPPQKHEKHLYGHSQNLKPWNILENIKNNSKKIQYKYKEPFRKHSNYFNYVNQLNPNPNPNHLIRNPGKKPTRNPGKKPTRKPGKKPTRKPGKKPTRKSTRKPCKKPTRN